MKDELSIYDPALKIETDADSFSAMAAAIFVAGLDQSASENPLVVLPTGHTPLGLYKTLITQYGHRRDLWDKIRFLALDEYAGLPPDDHRLFYKWVANAFLDPVGVLPHHRTYFNSHAENPDHEILRINQWLEHRGPIDLCVLGLGTNGHIAFNEPGSSFDQDAHLVRLTEDSINANAAYWGGVAHVPKTAFTLGLGQLALARQTILLVNGKHKAEILAQTLQGPITTGVPATYLRYQKHVTVIADKDAASLLSHKKS